MGFTDFAKDPATLRIAELALLFVLFSWLAFSRKQRDVVFTRLRLRGRRSSAANTPPRSVSPDKKEPNNAPPKSTEYVDTFPPSQREALANVAETLPEKQREMLGDLAFDEQSMAKNLMMFHDDFRKCDESRYTAAGISVREIKALGDFPDYAELSGVPSPEPYTEFNLDKAIPRPYRPFRWAYHQTMCKSLGAVYARDKS